MRQPYEEKNCSAPVAVAIVEDKRVFFHLMHRSSALTSKSQTCTSENGR
jgi:hypothetical protein